MKTATTPEPTHIYRLVHIDNLHVYLKRGGIHAPSRVPEDGLIYRPIHSEVIQSRRGIKPVEVGAGGTIRDYVSFYFGYRSPMLLVLENGGVSTINPEQEVWKHTQKARSL